jgi:hypothetical protein
MGEKSQNKDDAASAGRVTEKRREDRYPVSPTGPRYIEMKVRAGNEYVPVVIDNLSRHGIQFESPLPFCAEAQAECLISIAQSLSKDLAFSILIKHCDRKGDSFICGATVQTVADVTWFDIFVEVHNYILQRKGTIY